MVDRIILSLTLHWLLGHILLIYYELSGVLLFPLSLITILVPSWPGSCVDGIF